MTEKRQIPVILGGPAAGEPVPATWPLAVAAPDGTVWRYRRWHMGIGGNRTRHMVEFVALDGLELAEALALAFDWLVEHAFAEARS